MNEQKILTGKGITVAVLDTGIFPHIDFDNRIVAFRDLVYGRETPYDDNGHGTHVCGILGGSGRASGGKYRGTAPECRFLVAKILDRRGNGRKQDILAAIDWVCKERIRLNIRILNISVGTTEQEKSVDDLLVQAVERAWDDGITVVTAAGNLGPAPGSITAPGSSRKVITVGAICWSQEEESPDAARHGTASANRILSRLENVSFPARLEEAGRNMW
mgnify:CR=1 FL=1